MLRLTWEKWCFQDEYIDVDKRLAKVETTLERRGLLQHQSSRHFRSASVTGNLNMAPVAAVSSGTHMDVSKIPNNAHPKWWKDPGMRKLAGAMAMG